MRTNAALALLLFSTPAWADCVYTGAKRAYLECIYNTAVDALASALGLQASDAAQTTRLDDVDGALTDLRADVDATAASLAALTMDHETRLSAVEATAPAPGYLDSLAAMLNDHGLRLDGLDDAVAALSAPPSWNDLTDVPADLADGDGGQTWTTGDGLLLAGNQLSLDSTEVESIIDADHSLVRSNIAAGITLKIGLLNRNGNIIEYTSPGGASYTLDFTGIAATQTRINASQTIAMVRASGVATKLYLDISSGPGACTLWPYDNDAMMVPFQVSTDGGNGDGLIWPGGGKWTLALNRPGNTTYAIENAETYAIVCFAF